MVRYGAIDVGSNAVRLLIADVIGEGNELGYKKNTFIRVPIRLGEDAFSHKKISEEKSAALVKTMLAFKNLMEVYQVTDYLACATSAMREATNADEVLSAIQTVSGINLEVIDGTREADIIYANHIENQLDEDKQYLYIDVGGGSTELSIFAKGNFGASKSFDIGTIRLLEGRVKEETWGDMRDWVQEHCKNFKQLNAIGTGGNINKLFRLSGGKEFKPLAIKKLSDIYNNLKDLSLAERISAFNLNLDRADVIVPAGQIYLTLMKCAHIKQIYVPKVGLADGIIRLLMEKNLKD